MHSGRPGPLRPPPGFVLGATVGVCHQSLARPQLIINHEPITIYEYFEKKRKEKNANNFKSNVGDSTLSTNNVDIPIF